MSISKLHPSYSGYVGSTKDALLIIQKTIDDRGQLVTRRPNTNERSFLIKSGNVFVFIEEHSGIKRWTDGISWSPSRILGRFLVYRELDKHSLLEKNDKKRKKVSVSFDSGSQLNSSKLITSCAFKDKGLIKKTLSLTTTSEELSLDKASPIQTIHLISYYCAEDVLSGKLRRPSETDLKDLEVSAVLWDAVKATSLGGKIPIEDEVYYFPDSNFQLQNMSSLIQHQAFSASQQKPFSDPLRAQYQLPTSSRQFQYSPSVENYSRHISAPQTHSNQPLQFQQHKLLSVNQNQFFPSQIDGSTLKRGDDNTSNHNQDLILNNHYGGHVNNSASSFPSYVYDNAATNSNLVTNNIYFPPYIHFQQPVYHASSHISGTSTTEYNNSNHSGYPLINEASSSFITSNHSNSKVNGTGSNTSRFSTSGLNFNNQVASNTTQSKKYQSSSIGLPAAASNNNGYLSGESHEHLLYNTPNVIQRGFNPQQTPNFAELISNPIPAKGNTGNVTTSTSAVTVAAHNPPSSSNYG